MEFRQSREVSDYEVLFDGLSDVFSPAFKNGMTYWCDKGRKPDGTFWQVWLVELDGKVIGVCGLYSLDDKTEELWLGWFGIVKEMRNMHYGKSVMTHLYHQASILGCKRIYSYVDKDGGPLNFYKREGFSILGRVSEYLNDRPEVDHDEFEDMNDYVIMMPTPDCGIPHDLSTKKGSDILFEYLREEYKQGKKEFRIHFNESKGPTHFIIHPVNANGTTEDFVLTFGDVI